MSCAVNKSGRRSRGEREGAGAVEVLNGEPLEVHDLGGACRSPVGDHVGDVLDQLQQATPARPMGETSGGR